MDENNPARMKYCLDLNLTLHKWDYISSLRSSCNICDFQAVHLGYIERKHKTGLSSINVHLTLSWMGGGRLCIFIDIYAIFFFDFLSKSLSCRSSRHNGTIPLNPQILILLQFESPDLESLYFESPLLWIPLPWIPRFWIPLPWVPRFWIPFTMNTQNRVLKNDSFFP